MGGYGSGSHQICPAWSDQPLKSAAPVPPPQPSRLTYVAGNGSDPSNGDAGTNGQIMGGDGGGSHQIRPEWSQLQLKGAAPVPPPQPSRRTSDAGEESDLPNGNAASNGQIMRSDGSGSHQIRPTWSDQPFKDAAPALPPQPSHHTSVSSRESDPPNGDAAKNGQIAGGDGSGGHQIRPARSHHQLTDASPAPPPHQARCTSVAGGGSDPHQIRPDRLQLQLKGAAPALPPQHSRRTSVSSGGTDPPNGEAATNGHIAGGDGSGDHQIHPALSHQQLKGSSPAPPPQLGCCTSMAVGGSDLPNGNVARDLYRGDCREPPGSGDGGIDNARHHIVEGDPRNISHGDDVGEPPLHGDGCMTPKQHKGVEGNWPKILKRCFSKTDTTSSI